MQKDGCIYSLNLLHQTSMPQLTLLYLFALSTPNKLSHLKSDNQAGI